MSVTAAPPDLQIKPRDLAFGRGEKHARWWHGGDPVATAFWNALSLTFPQGEAFFVRSVRHYVNDVPEPLRSQVEDFARQEAYHSREHMALNRQVTEAGYDTREIDDAIRADIQRDKDQPPEVHLAATAALEHFTAMLAHAMLADTRHFADCPAELQRLWQWHAVEEIEHKGVAFDTFMYVTRDLSPFKRWLFRVMVMVHISIDFWRERRRDLHVLFRQDGIDTPQTWRRLLKYLFLKPGLIRQVFLPYLAYYLPGFHPWQHDDRKLAADTERRLGLDAAA
jgi:uncharacterized protein